MEEIDPNGLTKDNMGAKFDGNKPDMDLVLGGFSRALIEVAKVGTAGAKKYSRDGWLQVPNGIDRYKSAELRHYFKEKGGEIIDPDFGYLHAAHRAWNALASLELLIEERNKKDQLNTYKNNAYSLNPKLRLEECKIESHPTAGFKDNGKPLRSKRALASLESAYDHLGTGVNFEG